jgi:hypothetical protein
VALAVWELLRPATIVLADRDLLSLRVTQANMNQNGCPDMAITLQHQVGLPADGAAPATLIAGVLRDDERPEAQAALLRQAALRLAPAGTLLLGGGATALTRAETALRADGRLEIVERMQGGAGLLARREAERDGAARRLLGVLVIDKPAGLTHDVVARVRRLTGSRASATPARSTRPPPALTGLRRRGDATGRVPEQR